MSDHIERDFVGCSRDVFFRNVQDGGGEPFCTQDNWQSSVIYLTQELELSGLPSICSSGERGQGQLDVISLVNVTWTLAQSQRDKVKKIADLENQVRRLTTDIEQMHINAQKLRDLNEYKERQANDFEERERQACVLSQQLTAQLKMAKDEVKRFSAMVLHRESRYSHEAKKRDHEIAKLKERLLKIITENKVTGSSSHHNHVQIEVIGEPVAKPEGKTRGRWKNDTEEQKRGDELIQRVIQTNQDKQDELLRSNEALKRGVIRMLTDISSHIGHELNSDIIELPLANLDEAPLQSEVELMLKKMSAAAHQMTVDVEKLAFDDKTNDIRLARQSLLQDYFALGSFVPLSEVKHTAPPDWVSRGSCTLPPTGKVETPRSVKLRSSGSGGEAKPRPRSTHLSPYRGMQTNRPTGYNSGALGKVTAKTTSQRCGSLSPSSVSPTRGLFPGDSRSLPRMTGTRLSLRPSTPSQPNSSANNSSADESSGPVSTYRRLVGRRPIRPPSSRPTSPPVRGAVASGDSESESNNTELTQQLKKLGKYIERREQQSDNPDEIFDAEMDEHLVNIRKALAQKANAGSK